MATDIISSLLKLKNKVAIVTGGCKGIGRGCVDVFVEQGGKVVIFDIEDAIGAEIDSTGKPNSVGGEIHYIRCDVRDEENIKSAIKLAVEKYGKIDCLVNNAGWHPPAKKIDDFTTEEFRQLFDLNLMSVFTCCKYALPHIRKTKGSVVNISSIAGGYGQDEAVTYCATKGGVIALTKGLALDEGKHGVRVNVISPGAVLTPMYKSWAATQGQYADLDAVLKEASTYNILSRIGDPREIGEACLFLATGGTYMTGAELPVSGGMEVGYGHRL